MRQILIILFLFSSLMVSPSALAENTGEKSTRTALDRKREALSRLQARQNAVRSQIDQKREAFKKAKTEFDRAARAEEINVLQEELGSLEDEFSRVSTGVNLDVVEESEARRMALSAEVRQLLEPLLQELREATAAPRETAELRSEIADLQKKLELLGRAEETLSRLEAESLSPGLEMSLESERRDLSELKQSLEAKLSVAEFELAQREESAPPVVESLSDFVQGFFRTKGVHLMIAIVSMVLTIILMRKSYRVVMKVSPKKMRKGESFAGRVIYFSYMLMTTLGGVFAFLLALYLANDWVLLSIALLFILGVVWTGRNTLPQFFEQTKLMLNLGPVRKGERLIYGGIPWEVQRINFYTDLKNAALEGGLIRLPINVLQDLHSRPNGDREIWFPSKEDDWIKLSDETFGKVIQQTPDYVHLVKLGGSRKVIPTSDFLELHPENLSRNFRVLVTFGIDYGHQSIATSEVPRILEAAIHRSLLEKVEKNQLLSLKVFFTSAAASSLDYRIVADFTGELAPRLRALQDLITSTCVDTCNKHGWVIPFTQITVHQATADQPSRDSNRGSEPHPKTNENNYYQEERPPIGSSVTSH